MLTTTTYRNAFCILFSLVTLNMAAQTISSQKGLTTAAINTPQGTITIYLPDDIRPGDHISGTVSANPTREE